MKRSRLGVGAKSLARGSTFPARTQGLARTPAAKARTSPGERERRTKWWEGWEVAICVSCGARGCDPHHIIIESRCRSKARALGRDEAAVAYDLRNRLWVCRPEHAAHHLASPRLTWALLVGHAPDVFAFAVEIESEFWLERTYPGAP